MAIYDITNQFVDLSVLKNSLEGRGDAFELFLKQKVNHLFEDM